MWCVIPVAGKSSRLRSVTGGRPKTLLPLGGVPLIGHLLGRLGPPVRDVCLIVDDPSGLVRDALGSRWAHGPLCYIEQTEPLGVAHAVGVARDRVTGPFLVVMGDSYFETSLVPAVREWEASGADGAILVEPASDRAGQTMGLVEVEGERVTSAAKKRWDGSTTWSVAGAMILPQSFFAALDETPPAGSGEQELEDAVQRLLAAGHEFRAVRYAGWRRNVNTREDLEAVRERLATESREVFPTGS